MSEPRPSAAVEAYLSKLPEGLASYPDVLAKGSLATQLLEGLPPEIIPTLPAPLAALALKPPAASAWISEVHLSALMLARMEFLGLGHEQAIAWFHAQNVKLLRQPLNRLLLMVATPSVLLNSGSSRFESFHKGTRVFAMQRGKCDWTVNLTFRPHLFPPLVIDAFRISFQAAMEQTGVKEVSSELVESSPTHAVFGIRWAER